MKRIYRTPEAVIRAAARKIGGRLAFYDGYAVLHQVTRNDYDQIVNEYLSAEEAARLAGLRYDADPDNRYEFAV